MTAPLTPAEVEQFAKLSAELDGGDITFYPTADDVAIVKRVLRALTAAPIDDRRDWRLRLAHSEIDDIRRRLIGNKTLSLHHSTLNALLDDADAAERFARHAAAPIDETLCEHGSKQGDVLCKFCDVALSAAPTVAPGDGQTGSNYVANSEHSPTEIWFANGRHVKIAGGCLIVDFENKP